MAGALAHASDAATCEADQAYLEQHNIKSVLGQLLHELLKSQPKDPVQYMVDALSMPNAEDAVQDKFGLSKYRREALMKIFRAMDKDGSGEIEFQEIKAHSSKYGGQALTEAELREVFRDIDTTNDHKVSAEEFLAFFARSVAKIDNEEFDRMIKEMLD